MTTLAGPALAPRRGPVRQLVVLLHGWGADGNDLISLAPALREALPQARFAGPHAPDPCDQNPGGRQWYSFLDRRPEAPGSGHERAAALIDAYLDAELERLGLEPRHLALVGFSQGAMMALHVALRRPLPVAGAVSCSGMLLDPGSLAAELASRPPLLLVHGDEDPVVPFDSLHDAVAALARAEVPTQWHVSRGGGHTIAADAVEAMVAFLGNAFANAARVAR